MVVKFVFLSLIYYVSIKYKLVVVRLKHLKLTYHVFIKYKLANYK
jgi:hypothetical protein